MFWANGDEWAAPWFGKRAQSPLTQRNWNTNLTVVDPLGASGAAFNIDRCPLGMVDGFTIHSGSGGVGCTYSICTVSHNNIRNCCSSGNGAGISCDTSVVTVEDNVIVGNRSGDRMAQPHNGGGIYFANATSTVPSRIVNNTIACNSADNGGGIYLASGSTAVSNNIVALNSSGGIYKAAGSHSLQKNDVWQNTSYDYSGLTAGSGDICNNPLFLSSSSGDFHILTGSPCKDAGTNSVIQSNMDIDGGTRIYNGTVDIGADEWNGNPPGPTTAIVCVKPAGNDDNNGSTWTLAKRTIGAGLDAAVLRGGEVWVAAGTYSETITIPSFVGLYGGFSGAETARAQRNWTSNPTIIDATGTTNKHAVTMDGSFAAALDGFTVRNSGPATGHVTTGLQGGGVYIRSGSSTVTNNTITANRAAQGGGIYCKSADASITNNTITGNEVDTGDNDAYGGGIYCVSCSPTVQGNTIQSNSAEYRGGGIYCSSASPNICQNTIQSNTASDEGGGICCEQSGAPTISQNTIKLNVGTNEGGGVCSESASPTIEANLFDSNFGTNHAGGVALHTSTGVRIANNVFVHNHAEGPSGLGGGAVHSFNSGPVIVNNTFVENYVGTGTWPNITVSVGAYGGAVHVRGTPVTTFANNIFCNNKAYYGSCVGCTSYGSTSVSFCDAFPDPGAPAYYKADALSSLTVAAGSCCYVDPLFCNGVYWLQQSSPLRTSYHGTSNSPAASLDIEGHSRPGLDGFTDMGAYENDGRACP